MHRDTRIGCRPGKNPLWVKPFQIFLIRFPLNDSANESTMIHILIHTTIQQKIN